MEKFPRKGLFAPESKYWYKGWLLGMLIDRKKIRKKDMEKDEGRYVSL